MPPLFEFNNLKLPDLKDRLSGNEYQVLKADILALMFTQRTRTFDLQKGPNGPWKRLGTRQSVVRFKKLPRKKQREFKTPGLAQKSGAVKLLQDTRLLVKSFTIPGASFQETSIAGDDVALSTNVKYAKIHNEGGTIRHPGTENGFGRGIHINPYLINIPKRQYDHFSKLDESEIQELINSYLNDPRGAFE